MANGRILRALTASTLIGGLVVGVAISAPAVGGGIASVKVDSFRCTVTMADGTHPFFGGNACATFVATGGEVFGAPPASDPPGGVNEGGASGAGQTQMSSGRGTDDDPFVITTSGPLGSTGLALVQRDEYVVGNDQFTTTVELANHGESSADAVLYRAVRCFEGDRRATPTDDDEQARCKSVATNGSIALSGDDVAVADEGNVVVDEIKSGDAIDRGCSCASLSDPALVASRAVTIEPGERTKFKTKLKIKGPLPSAAPPTSTSSTTTTAPTASDGGSFGSCRASAVRVDSAPGPLAPLGVVEPFVANDADEPCRAETSDVVGPTAIGPVTAAVVHVETTDTEHSPVQIGDQTTAVARVATVDVDLGALVISARMLIASANSVPCDGAGTDPALEGDSHVASLTINGSPVEIPSDKSDPSTPTLDLSPLGTLWLREEITTSNSLTERTLELDTIFGNITIGEARVDKTGNPCAVPPPCPGGKQALCGGGARYL